MRSLHRDAGHGIRRGRGQPGLPIAGGIHLREERGCSGDRDDGTWSQERYAEHLAALQHALVGAGLTWRGEPVWARYDPPWKPWFLRRNEIWLELD